MDQSTIFMSNNEFWSHKRISDEWTWWTKNQATSNCSTNTKITHSVLKRSKPVTCPLSQVYPDKTLTPVLTFRMVNQQYNHFYTAYIKEPCMNCISLLPSYTISMHLGYETYMISYHLYKFKLYPVWTIVYCMYNFSRDSISDLECFQSYISTKLH